MSAFGFGAGANAAERAGEADGKASVAPFVSDNTFTIGIGYFYAKASTNASYNSNVGIGTDVDFEQILGLDDRSNIPLFDLQWRFADRWALTAEYFDLKRKGSKTLQEEVEWGDEVYPIGADIKSQFDVRDTRVMVDYAVFKDKDKAVGLGLGAHVMSLRAQLAGTGFQTEKADVLAPLPVISAFASMGLTDTWGLSMRVDWLSVNYQEYSGDLRSTGIDLLYQPFHHVGFSLGYRSVLLDVKVDGDDWNGRVDMTFNGPAFRIFGTF